MAKSRSVATGVPKSQETLESDVDMAGSEVDSDDIDAQASSEESSEGSESSSEEEGSDGENQGMSGGALVIPSSKKKDGKWP
jgi:hypothetical protein